MKVNPAEAKLLQKALQLIVILQEAIDKGLKAGEWVGAVSSLMNGKGGGKAESAQASGTNVSASTEVLKKAADFASSKLGVTPSAPPVSVQR